MQTLNLPEIELKIREKEANYEIFDIIRKKYVFLTPEEWVRQHFVHYLISHLKYPKSLIKVETGLKYNQLTKRSDILAYSSEAKPFLLVECKSFKVKINKTALEQAAVYNKNIDAPYLVLTNGIKHYCWTKDGGNYSVMNEIPPYLPESIL